MNIFENPKDIDYSPLFEFLSELCNEKNDDYMFAYRFSFIEDKATIELIQYGRHCPILSLFIPLDGDPFVIASFLRCYNYKIINYTPLKDIEQIISKMTYSEITRNFNLIRNECFSFRDYINKLYTDALKLYEDKNAYYTRKESIAVNSDYDFSF